jgi:hypothetical protein
MKCQRCGSDNVRKSKRGNAHIFFPINLFVTSIRCCNCQRRFLCFGFLPGRDVPDAQESSHAKLAC